MTQHSEAFDLPRQIEEVGLALVEPTQQIEHVFLDVGEELSGCMKLMQHVVSEFEALPQEFNGDSIMRATEQLTHVSKRALQMADDMTSQGSGLARLSSALAKAASPVDQLRRTVKMMGIVATNARVGAASLSEKTDGFVDFADDVSVLSASMTATVSKFFATYTELLAAVVEVARAQKQFTASQREPLASAAAALDVKLHAVTLQRNDASSRSAETSRMTRDIVMKVGETVMAMQSGDAVRQRLEHVHAALGLASQAAGSGNSVLRLLELQRRQMASARDMLASELDMASSKVEQLSGDIQLLLEHSRSLESGGEKQSVLGALHLVVQDVIGVLRKCEADRRKLDAVSAEVAETVQTMLCDVESVEKLEQKMRVVSLNAAVRCARLDQRGRALNVIAQQLRDLTREILSVAEASVLALREATEISAEFSTSLDANDATSIGELEDQATAAMALLSGFNTRLESAMNGLSQDVPAIRQRLVVVRKLLNEGNSITSAVLESERRVAVFARAECNEDVTTEFYDTLRQGYTMDVERQIHDEFFSPRPLPATAAADEASVWL